MKKERKKERKKKGKEANIRDIKKTMTSRSRSDKPSSFTLITRLLSPEMFLKPIIRGYFTRKEKISNVEYVPRKLALAHFNFYREL